MECLRIATFNCGGDANNRRRKVIFDYLRTLNSHVFYLQETHSAAHEEKQWVVEWGRSGSIFHSSSKNRENGVAILLNHPDLKFSSWFSDRNGCIIAVDLELHSNSIHIVNIYAPQRNLSIQDRTHFFRSLYVYTHSLCPTVLAGDFNVVENPKIDHLETTIR